MIKKSVNIGKAALQLEIRDGMLHSLGAVSIGGAALRPNHAYLLEGGH